MVFLALHHVPYGYAIIRILSISTYTHDRGGGTGPADLANAGPNFARTPQELLFRPVPIVTISFAP